MVQLSADPLGGMSEAMWWNHQNLEIPRKDASGAVWHFRVWHDHVDGMYRQRVFFWNDARSETGVVELHGDQVLHVSRLKQVITKLIKQPEYRARHQRAIEIPVERKYSVYEPLE